MGLLLFAAVAVPILEEYVFRGLLQASLRDKAAVWRRQFGPVSLANAVTSVLFAASHLFEQPPLQAAAVFLPSLVFGYVFERYRHVAPAMLLHGIYNAGYVWLFAAT